MFGFLKKKEFIAPVDGTIKSIEEVNDPVFAQKMMGDGFAISTTGDTIYACGDGEITMVYPSGHAIGMRLTSGLEVLLHIGIDTVNENGRGFHTFVSQGSNVQKGTCLVQIDRSYLLEKGYDITLIVIFTDCTSYHDFKIFHNQYVSGGIDKAALYW